MTNDEHRMLKVGSIYMPILMVVSVIIGAIYFTYLVSTERAQIYTEIGGVKTNIERLTETLDRFITNTDQRLSDRVSDRYSREAFINDCLRLQIANPKWNCIYVKPEWKASYE